MKKRNTTEAETVVGSSTAGAGYQNTTANIMQQPAAKLHQTTTAVGVEQRLKKKRVRNRKKATKKLSAAVLCANPGIKRFI